MRAALLSFHNAYNYGAALQAYALQCAVENLGVECEYLNYQNAFRKHAYDMKYQMKSALAKKNVPAAVKSVVGMPVMSARAEGFNQFYANHLKTTKTVFSSSEEARKVNGAYDKFIVGSDQVWNYAHNGEDTAYLLDFVDDDRKKISYSSSFGVSSLAPEISGTYAELLKKFNRLSSRERVGVEIIEQVAGRQAHLVLDPVFLIGSDEWEKIREKKGKPEKNYIFFYTNRQSQIQDFLNTGYASDEVFHVLSTHLTPKEVANRRIKPRVSMSPEEFLDEIACAEFVVTASFHCLAMSLIYHKQFTVILTGDHGKDERIVGLLKLAGLEDRILTSSTTKEDLKKPIDYREVDRRLKIYLDASIEYLRRAIFDEPDIPFAPAEQANLFCQDSRCTGCGACAASCPCGAISMKRDAEGFQTPVLDETLCIHCHKCHTVCQVYAQAASVASQHYYAVKNRDEVRQVSSSGGMFRALAERTFAEHGIVCAAGMDQTFHVYHMFASNLEELKPMCGTYYVQSDLRDAYQKVRAHLQSKQKVLFVGTACQVAGLKLYLGGNDENLLTCDILCHGAPSPMAFEKFIAFLQTKGNLTAFKFRDKSLGWKGYHVSAVIDGKLVKNKLWLQSFNNLFSHNMINRQSCGACKYTNYNRPGDLTIGDFWGLENSHPEYLDDLGVSLVMTNTEKGQTALDALELRKLDVRKEDTAQNSLKKPAAISARRLQVFQMLRTGSYSEIAKIYGEANAKGRLKNTARKLWIQMRKK